MSHTFTKSSSVRRMFPDRSPENSFIPFFDHSRHFTGPVCRSLTWYCLGLPHVASAVCITLSLRMSWGMSLGI